MMASTPILHLFKVLVVSIITICLQDGMPTKMSGKGGITLPVIASQGQSEKSSKYNDLLNCWRLC